MLHEYSREFVARSLDAALARSDPDLAARISGRPELRTRKWFDAYRGRELHFIRDVLNKRSPRTGQLSLWEFQRHAARRLLERRRLAMSTCRSAGKTHMLGYLAAAFLFCERSRVIVITPTMRQGQKGVMSEARQAITNASEDIHLEANNASEIRVDERHWMICLPARDPDAMRGFHASPVVPDDPDADRLSEEDVEWLKAQSDDGSSRLLIIIDEASGVDKEAFRVMRGVMSKPNVYVIYSGNPTLGADEDHPYVQAFREGSAFYRVRTSTLPITDFPPPSGIEYDKSFDHVPEYMVDGSEVALALKEHDRSDPILISDWAGTFPAGSADWSVVPRRILEAAVATRGSNLRPLGPRIGVDIGTGRPDMCVASLFLDGEKRTAYKWAPEADDSEGQIEIADTIMALATKWGEEIEGVLPGGSKWDGSPIPGERISIDDSGLVGVGDILASRGMYVDRVNFANRPAGQWADIIGLTRFKNVRAEMHWVARRGLQEGVFVIPSTFRESWREAGWTRFSRDFDSAGPIVKLEPKEAVVKRHGHSPDTFDADLLAMRTGEAPLKVVQAGREILTSRRQPIKNGRLRPTRLPGARRIQ